MANLINSSYLLNYQNAGQLFNNFSVSKNSNKPNPLNAIANAASSNFNINLSKEGISALQNQPQSDDIDTSLFATNKELSPKAQNFLGKLQEKYGDNYDFFVADNVDDPQALTAGSTKNYSVIFSSDEIEKMANDDEYATSLLGKVDDAVKSFDDIIEKANLDGKAQFSSLAVSFDDSGNSKFFATLEKLSESQQASLDAAKERAKESVEVDEQPATFSINADDSEGLLEKLFNVNWDKVFVS